MVYKYDLKLIEVLEVLDMFQRQNRKVWDDYVNYIGSKPRSNVRQVLSSFSSANL